MQIPQERCGAIRKRVEENPVLRFLTTRSNLLLFYGIFLFLYEIRFLRHLVPALHPVLIGWAGALVLYDLLVRRSWRQVHGWPLVALFVVTTGITAVSNMEAGLIMNLKSAVMTSLPLLVFYPLCAELSGEDRERALLKSLLGAAAVYALASLTALVLFLLRVSREITFLGETGVLGFHYYLPGDPTSGILLYGVFEDTNHSAAYALVFAAYSLWLFSACRRGLFHRSWVNRAGKVFGIVNAVIQLCYFPLANSRGGWLCMAVAGGLAAFLYAYCTRLSGRPNPSRGVLSAVAAVLSVAVLCGGLLAARTAFSATSNLLHAPSQQVSHTEEEAEDEALPPSEEDVFTKKDEYMGAGRLDIWKETLQLATKRPLFGVGPENNAYYAKQYGVGVILATGKAIHNSYLDLLLDYGIVGTVLLMALFVLCVLRVLAGLRREQKPLPYYLALFSVVLTAGVSALLSCVFINTTAMYFLMLTMLSYLLPEKTKKKEDNTHE